MRLFRSLAGTWQFQLDPDGVLAAGEFSPEREISVPLPWQAAFPDLAEYSGYAWYRTEFELDPEWLQGELLLEFGAVDYWCEVFVNGQRVGEHEGGYTPFRFQIGHFSKPGTNVLQVRVYDSIQSEIAFLRHKSPNLPATPAADVQGPPFDARNIPHGKQEWYINVGGIWQDVTLTAVPKLFIAQAHVLPDIAAGSALFRITLGGATDTSDGRLQIQVANQVVEHALEHGKNLYESTVRIPNPHLWDTADPFLYRAVISLETGAGRDELPVQFGMREIRTREGQLLLNGEPIFLLSALDQDIYADTIYTVPSDDYLRDQFRKAQQLGLNCLRCHIKPPDPRYLELADEMGLLVWAEIPSWRTFYPKDTVHPATLVLDDDIKRRVRETLQAMIARDMNHPSLVIWTIVNEDWGTSLPLSAADRAWVAEMYDACKALDPTRLVVDNSACLHAWGPNVHVRSDLDDFHIYANIPDQARSFEQNMEAFNLRPMWTWSNEGDADRRGDEPLILSEFGNWGLPDIQALRAHYGGDPPWFDLGPWWSGWEGEPGWARGVEERFHALGLDTLWKNYQEFAIATQWHEYAALKFQIETMRRQERMAGYVITELADTYWESNGLLDFLRNPKIFNDLFATINAPDVLVAEPEHYASWDDALLGIRIYGSHYGGTDWGGARLRRSIAGAELDSREIAPQRRGTVQLLDERHWKLPRVDTSQQVLVRCALDSADGDALASNTLQVLVLPARARRANYTRPVAVISGDEFVGAPISSLSPNVSEDANLVESPPQSSTLPDPAPQPGIVRHDLATSLRRLGYQTTRQLTADTEVAISNLPTAELLRWVREGGKLLFLGTGASPFFWIQSRGGAYSGNWITSYTWVRPEIHKRLAIVNPIGLPFRHCMPTRTILGLPVQDKAIHQDLLAGMISGWVRHPAVHTVQFRYGRGRVLMTTFALEEALENRPAAIAMLHDLVDHLVSDACDPVLKANY